MVEVYRTNVEDANQGEFLLEQLYKIFPDYRMNFDLKDCDNILRVEFGSGAIEVLQVIAVMNDMGFTAAALEDTPVIFKEAKKHGICYLSEV